MMELPKVTSEELLEKAKKPAQDASKRCTPFYKGKIEVVLKLMLSGMSMTLPSGILLALQSRQKEINKEP